MPDQPLRAVLFGAGDFGPILSRYIEQDAELVAICDPCEKARTNCLERIAKPLPQFADPSTAMEKLDFEIALIASPNHTHRDLTVAAAAAGRPFVWYIALPPYRWVVQYRDALQTPMLARGCPAPSVSQGSGCSSAGGSDYSGPARDGPRAGARARGQG